MIQVAKPFIGKIEIAEIEKVFSTGWLGMGSWVKEFEDGVAALLGCKNVIATNTGTTALHLALDVLDLKPGDEVIVPSMTFVATIQAIMQAGGTPVFCDVNLSDMNMSIPDVERKITSRTRVLLPVHYRGVPADMTRLMAIAEAHNLVVIEDAAHAFGSSVTVNSNQYRVGAVGHMTCFSFDPIKVVTTGEGGAITTNNDQWADRLRKKRILGIDKDTWSRYKNERSWFYDVTERGFRYHMSNINAAIGVQQLKQLDQFMSRRSELGASYDRYFSDSFFSSRIEELSSVSSTVSLFMYIVRILDNKRDGLMEYLKSKNIITGIHYIPNHRQTICQNFRADELTNTNQLADEILTLPLYFGLSDEEQRLVMNEIRHYFESTSS